MSKDRDFQCHAIIHSAAGAAGTVGAGLAQVPGADAVLIMPIQVAMIAALGRVFGVEITQAAAKSVTYATLGTILGRGASKVLPRLIPVIGNLVNASVAAGITETLGWTVVRQLEAGEFVG